MTERLRILVVGSGGREHALVWKLAQSPLVDLIHIAPGNGGADGDKVANVNIHPHDFTGLVQHAKKHGLNLVVVGPEAPLVEGIQDIFWANGIRCFGPSKRVAQMEGSKAFSKAFMQRHGIPTAASRTFCNYDAAKAYLEEIAHTHRVVIKADGLAAGKGVIIPTSADEGFQALKEIMVDRQFGGAGDQVVIEEFLDGEELSVLTFSDGYTIKSLPPAQDHKRAFDGDQGPNTGGMGCYAPTRVATKELIAQIDQKIVQPTIDCMRREGMPFVGMLFTGLMITDAGPKVLEYNVRGGDPETQTLLPLLSEDTDLARVLLACTEHWLDGVELKIEPKFAATVVACAEGYPGPYAKNRQIYLEPSPPKDTLIFHAGTARTKDGLVTTGGRVIAATATGETIESAVIKAYECMKGITFEGMHYRRDIAHRAFKSQKQLPDGVPVNVILTNGVAPKEDLTNGHSTQENLANGTSANGDVSLTYASAGVSIDAGNSLVESIKASVKSTARPGADAVIGGFGGVFDLAAAGYSKSSPALIGAIDGVGTKLKLAYAMNVHDTVGIDLVAMNVNDLVVQGAEPLFFLDCYTCSVLDVDIATSFVQGVAKGCQLAGCALIGGETAEMPGLLSKTEYDAVGAAVGAVDTPSGQKILPDKASMVEGDVVLGLASSGVHSNGFSLVRRILEHTHLVLTDPAPWDSDVAVGHSLLTPTRIYVKALLPAVRKGLVKGMSHITGGGLLENVPRMLPTDLAADIDVLSWARPAVFDWLQQAGNVSDHEMSRTFNNGIGMVLVVSDVASDEVTRLLEAEHETVYRLGRLVRRNGGDGCVLHNVESWRS